MPVTNLFVNYGVLHALPVVLFGSTGIVPCISLFLVGPGFSGIVLPIPEFLGMKKHIWEWIPYVRVIQ